MTKGWHGNPEGHSLAARGIKIKANKINLQSPSTNRPELKINKSDKIREKMIKHRQRMVDYRDELKMKLDKMDKGFGNPKKIDMIMIEIELMDKKIKSVETQIYTGEALKDNLEFWTGANWFKPGFDEFYDHQDIHKYELKAGATKKKKQLFQPRAKNIKDPNDFIDEVYYRRFDGRTPSGFFVPSVREVSRVLRNQPIDHSIENIDMFESQPQRIIVDDQNIRIIPALYKDIDPLTKRENIIEVYPLPSVGNQNSIFERAITHEVGHNIFNNLKKGERKAYKDLAKESKADPVSRYSTTNVREDFSENYAFFVTGQRKLDEKREKYFLNLVKTKREVKKDE